MTDNSRHEKHSDLLLDFHSTLIECRRLFADSSNDCTRECPQLLARSKGDFATLMQDLERGLLVKLFVEIAHSDEHWTDAELSLVGALFEHCWNQSPEPDQMHAALAQVIDHARQLNWASLVKPFCTFPVLRERIPRLLTMVMRLGNVVAKIDGRVTSEEVRKLKSIQEELRGLLEPKSNSGQTDGSTPDGAIASESKAATARESSPVSVDAKARRGPAPTPRADPEELAKVLAELDALIGLGSVKHDLIELVNFLKVQAERVKFGLAKTSVSLHMVYCGNPGTGKTTVARLMGRAFGAMGLLARGHLVETDRSGLVAKYAGQTSPKTHQKVDEALDGVLFIDEAYSLVAEKGDDPFGQEAIQALLKRVEDDRQRLVCVLAGYPGPMEALLEANPGLSSRFSRRLDFPDYTTRELCHIVQAMCDQNLYVLPAATRLRLLCLFHHLVEHRDETFGNGRLARNLFESAIRRLSNRIADVVPLTRELLTVLEPADFVHADVPESEYLAFDSPDLRLYVSCSGCQGRTRFRPEFLGQVVRCKLCEHEFRVDWGDLPA